MFREMRRKRQQLDEAACRAVLERGTSGVLAVSGDDGYPYATPVNYILVGDKLYLHSAPYGYKIECLQRDPKCCFTAILSTEIIPSKITASFESVILTGQAVFVEDPAEKRTVMENFVTQKHPGYEELGFRMIEKQLDKTAVIRIDPISMTGKAYLG